MCALNTMLGIKTKLSTAFHPQTDRQTEEVNQDIEQYLRLFISHCQDDWPEWITIGEFAYNNKIHLAIQVSLFYTNYGYNPRMGVQPRRQSNVEAADDFTAQIKSIHKEAQAALAKA